MLSLKSTVERERSEHLEFVWKPVEAGISIHPLGAQIICMGAHPAAKLLSLFTLPQPSKQYVETTSHVNSQHNDGTEDTLLQLFYEREQDTANIQLIRQVKCGAA